MLRESSDEKGQRKVKADTFFRTKRAYVLVAVCVCVGVLLLAVGGGKPSTNDTASVSEDAYVRALEEQVAQLCTSVEGVGRCRVMITLARGELTEYEGSRVSAVRPPRVQGVTVICSGGGNAQVQKQLCDMLGALFDIGAHRVVILPLKK